MLLFIDSSNFDETKIALVSEKIVWHKFAAQNLSEYLLPEIKKFCKSQKVSFNDLKKIAVVAGPGPFSKIRTGVATANALAFGLHLPVVALKVSQIPKDLRLLLQKAGQTSALPYYDKQPNITKPKNK